LDGHGSLVSTNGAGALTVPTEGLFATALAASSKNATSTGLALAIGVLQRHQDAYEAEVRAAYVAQKERAAQVVRGLADLEESLIGSWGSATLAGATKDALAGGHLQRVCRYATMLTALVAPEHVDDPQFACGFLLHDIGKFTVPASVLTSTGVFSDAEWELMRQHPEAGRSVLQDIPFLSDARQIVHAHHERWDGNGYPRGLSGAAIPLGARIFSLSDAFNAMTTDRPHQSASSIDYARGELRKGSGAAFWPLAVDAFLSIPVVDLAAVRDAPSGVPLW
jgi:HD-GYP domain-containing protein (c-di-GMP phosphodiesterase class II)